MVPPSPFAANGVSPAAAAAAAAAVTSSSDNNSSSSSSNIPPLLHALVGWSTLWQFPPPPSVPRSLSLAVTRELAAVLALLQSASPPAAASTAAAAAAAALPRLLQLAEGGPFKKEIQNFLAALQIRIQASFDKAVGDLCLETLHGQPAATAAAAATGATAAATTTAAAATDTNEPQLGEQLPSMEEFKERIKLEKFAEKLKNAKKNSQKNIELHKPLVQRLKAELECLDTALKDILEKEEALKQRMPFASSSS